MEKGPLNDDDYLSELALVTLDPANGKRTPVEVDVIISR